MVTRDTRLYIKKNSIMFAMKGITENIHYLRLKIFISVDLPFGWWDKHDFDWIVSFLAKIDKCDMQVKEWGYHQNWEPISFLSTKAWSGSWHSTLWEDVEAVNSGCKEYSQERSEITYEPVNCLDVDRGFLSSCLLCVCGLYVCVCSHVDFNEK